MPEQENDLDFKNLFQLAPHLLLVLTPDFTIKEASEAYLQATMTTREIIGRKLFEVFPDNPDDPEATGIRNLTASLENVLKNRVPHTMAIQKYDIRRADGGFEVRYWSPVNSPLLGKDGEVTHIIHRVEDLTEFVLLKHQRLEQMKVTDELRERAEKMEAEIYLRAQEIHERTQELEKVNRELHIARDQAIEASRIKSEFLANMSHEIRTPLNGILGMTEIVLQNVIEPGVREHVMVIKEAGNSLLTVINDILDFSKIEAGKLSLDIAAYEPRKLIESIVMILSELARKKGLRLVTFIDPQTPQLLQGDSIRLKQVLLNLVGNAIKFSEQGEIKIQLNMEGQSSETVKLRFTITDQGIGLTPVEIKKLFQPFVQSDGSMSRKYGGTGLGLTISKNLVELMGGQIGVESTKGTGSTFCFTVEQFSVDSLIADTKEFPASKTIRPLKDPKVVHGPINAPSAPRTEIILVVEDHPINQQVALLFLKKLGFEAHITEDGQEAINILSERSIYSLVLMDVQIPGVDGLDVTRAVRANEKLHGGHIPIIAMTAHAFEGSRDTCIEAGMDDYLSKPIDPDELKKIIDRWLPLRELNRIEESKRS